MITGDKTIIKGLTKDSSLLIYNWVNQEDLRLFTGTVYPISEYEHENWIQHIASSTDKKLFLICDKESGVAIGTIGLKNFDSLSRHAELFISIGSTDFVSNKNKKSGYGSDAVITLTNYCFNHLNLHKVSVSVFASNIRAIRCYEKAGFTTEGVLREHHFSNGKYEDVIIMAKIAMV